MTWTITHVADNGHCIVEQHGGRLSVESEPGRTGFTLALPATVATSGALRSRSRLRVHDRRYRER